MAKQATKKTVEYAVIVTEAEKAVAGVKDPELRQAAFVKVLDTMLSAAFENSDTGIAPEESPPNRFGKSAKSQPKHPKRSTGTVGLLKELIDEGFFGAQRTIGAVKSELGNRGHHIPLTHLSAPLQRMCRQKFLRREKKSDGNKSVFAYSKW